jgi:hypothetical protein
MRRVQLTVRVLVRSSELPLPGALVLVSAEGGRTDEHGECRFSVRPGDLLYVSASASGFDPLGASGVLANDEQWTFYLTPAGGSE